jgi:hypothetical protein
MVCGFKFKHKNDKFPDDNEAITPDNVWISAEDYKHCLKKLRKDSNQPSPSAACGKQQDPAAPASQTLFVLGKLAGDGSAISWLKPLFPVPWHMRTTAQTGSGTFEVEAILDSGPAISEKFDPRLRVEHLEPKKVKSPPGYGFFCLALEIPSGRKVEKVIIRKEGMSEPLKVIDRRRGPDDLPVIAPITLASTPLKEKFDLPLRVTLNDPNVLRYHVLYSPDGGATFERVKINGRNNVISIDPSKFTSSQEGKGLLRIYASDGLNTVHLDVDKLTLQGM